MPRACDAKVWNEDLVLALRAREEKCRQRCSVRQYTWRDGATAIATVRRDIYQYKSSGKIVGLPTTISKTVEEECRAIIDGAKPILPHDYTPTTVQEKQKMVTKPTTKHQNTVPNIYYNDPYLKRIKMRGGAYAIVMAFHFSQAKTMTKTQLCMAAQEYCDEEMEPNYAAGRSYGAWSSKRTLLNHGLIRESRTTQMGRKGHMCNGVFEYSLTDNGVQFKEALLKKFPLTTNAKKSIPLKEHPRPVQRVSSDSNCPILRDRTSSQLSNTKEEFSTVTQSKKVISLLSDSESDSDESILENRNKISNHGLKPMASLTRPKVKMIANDWSSSSDESDSDISLDFRQNRSSSTATSHVDGMNASLAKLAHMIEIEDSDSDESDFDFDAKDSPILRKNEGSKQRQQPALRSTENVRPVLDTSKKLDTRKPSHRAETACTDTTLVVLIDNRERNRNATPRHMRMELTRHLAQSSGSLHQVWPSYMPAGVVEEDQLNYADFAFLARNTDTVDRLPVSIERKRISDLVQRSCRADHWTQLARMRDCCDHSILLVEGNTTKTCRFSSQEITAFEEQWTPDIHFIDDENAFYRFLGRAILSSPKLKFVQTKDEQASYRSVGAIGLLAMRTKWENSAPRTVPSSKAEINKLYSKLKSRGIPWQISRRVAEELVSEEQLGEIFKQAQASARSSTLTPIIAHSCSSLIETSKKRRLIEFGTIEGWSAAIYNAWFSKLKEPTGVTSVFGELKAFANDHAKLLAALHKGKSADSAVQESNYEDDTYNVDDSDFGHGRKVRIETQQKLARIFPNAGSDAFYKVRVVEENPLGLLQPSIVIHTVNDRFESDRMVLTVLEGKDMIQRIKDSMENHCLSESVQVAETIAKEINSECSSFLLRRQQDRRVLVVRGLFPAFDDAAKQAGYQAEFKVLADMVLAGLMLRHDLVTVHAYRLKNDLETIVREFSMACFYYQLTTRKLRQANKS